MKLYRYPVLVYELVLKLADVRAKYSISILSKRSKVLVRRITRKEVYSLCLAFSNAFLGHIYENKYREDIFKFEISPIDGFVERSGEKPTVDTDLVEETVEHLIETFSSPSVIIRLLPGFSYRVVANCISFIEKMNIQLKLLKYSSTVIDDESLRFVIEHARNADGIWLKTKVSPDFKIEVSVLQSMKASKFCFPLSPWLTDDHILNALMDRERVCVKWNVEPSIFNIFLKKWIEGSPITKFLCHVMRDYELASCFEGIGTTQVRAVSYDNSICDEACIIKQVRGQEAAISREPVEGGGYLLGLNTVYKVIQDFDAEDGGGEDVNAYGGLEGEDQ